MFLLLQSSQKFESRKEDEESRKWEGSCDRKRENSPGRVTQSLQATENVSLGRFDLHEVAKTENDICSSPVFMPSSDLLEIIRKQVCYRH